MSKKKEGRLSSKWRKRIILFLLKFKKFKVEDTIIICGEGRSGTTWLLDIINKTPKACTHWEPLHHKNGVVPVNWHWGDAPFIAEKEKRKDYYKFLNNILRYKIYNQETIRYKKQAIKSIIKSKFVVVKFVRANLLLPYILQNFNLKNKPILIIRHPIDVCFSKIKAFTNTDYIPIKLEDSINNTRFIKEASFLQHLETELEYNIALWCINYRALFSYPKIASKLTIVFYSDLILNPEKETRSILNKINGVKKTDIDTVISSINFKKPSGTDFFGDYKPNPEQQLQKNITKLSNKEKDSIQKVFDHFNFKLYDAYSVFPKKEYLEK